MGAPVTGFRPRTPTDVPANPVVGNGPPSEDVPTGDDKKLPTWVKWVIGLNLVMVHTVVILVGVDSVPFTLNDAALAAYVVTGLGIPIGLASQAVWSALGGIFGIKSL